MTIWEEFPRTRQVFEEGREQGLHRGVQIYVSKNHQTLLDAGWGAGKQPLTSEQIMLWMSSGKPLTAMALAVLSERGLLSWDDSLSHFLPEWAMIGQPDIALKHVLTHTAGFGNRELDWTRKSWDELILEVIQTPLVADWSVGEQAGYVVAASWFLLGEVIVRVTSRPFSEALRELVLEPLGMSNTFCGLSNGQFDGLSHRLGCLYGRSSGGLVDLDWNLRERVTSASPGGNCRGPISQLGRFYESLLPNSPSSIVSNETRNTLVARQRKAMFDETFQHQIDWGYGFIVNSYCDGGDSVPYGFGRYASESTFGHGGSQSSIGFADPEHQLVVAWVANGRVGEPRHHVRNLNINEAIYHDLGLT